MKQIKILLFLSIAYMTGIIVFITVMSKNHNPVKTPVNKAPASIQPSTRIEKSEFIVKGSIPYWDQDRALSSFKKYANTFGYINLFWYYLDDTGEVEKYETVEEDKSIIDFAHANKVKVLGVITNLSDKLGSTWDSNLVENVIKNKTSRDKHVSDIIEKIEEFDFDGVTIDYEEVEESQKENFSLFIKELSASFHKNDRTVAVALHPKTDGSYNNNGSFQDWEDLAKYADHLNIMAYGEHWDESSAGPVASASWVERIIGYSKRLGIPSEKFILGIPLYGYDWNKDHEEAGEGITYGESQQLLSKYNKEEKWDEKAKSPYFSYEDDDGDLHEVWFENAESVAEKIKIAKKADLGGVTFWRLGGEDPKIWEELKKVEK